MEDLVVDDVEEGVFGLFGVGFVKILGGFKGLLNGFLNGEEDEEFRFFIRCFLG